MKSYVTNTINLSCAKILLPSVIDPVSLSLLSVPLLGQGGVAKKMGRSNDGLVDKSKLVT